MSPPSLLRNRSCRAVLLAVALVLVAPTVPVAATAAPVRSAPMAVEYRPPVDAAVVDTFRPPATRYAAGNRGVDYDTDPGQPVRAAAAGEVTFAGSIGRAKHVVVLHADGVRTTYAFVDSIAARRGQRVEPGQVLATSGDSFHFGARVGNVYIDPLLLLGGGGAASTTITRLVDDVPAGNRHAATPAEERSGLVEWLRDLAAAVDGGAPAAWRLAQQHCTPAGADPEPGAVAPLVGRAVVLVGGLGSVTGHAAILDVELAALGYEASTTTLEQFSYRADGGPYTPADTQQPIDRSAVLLAAQVRRLHGADPSRPIDIYAHSQGGLVTRAALARHGLAGVARIVTIATPHTGTPVAGAAGAIRSADLVAGARMPDEQDLVAVAGALGIADIDPAAASVTSMAPNSAFLTELARLEAASRAGSTGSGTSATRPAILSVGAATDAVVPAHRAAWPGERHVIVDLEGGPTPGDHGRATGATATTRELGHFVRGVGASCVDEATWIRRLLTARAVEQAQRIAVAALVGLARRTDDLRRPPGSAAVVRR